jgi:RNA polymerase sigma factor (sigma-70 family)
MARERADDRARDADLLEAWRGGDERAGEQLFDRHADAVARFFENKVPRDAEDLVHGTFVRVLEGRDRVRNGEAFRTYVLAIARNVLREHVRELGRGRRLDPGVDSLAELAPGPSTLVGEREEHQLLLDGLRRLPIDDQILLELFYWERLDSGALGEIIGMPASSVRGRLGRARERLKQAMKELSTARGVVVSVFEGIDGWATEMRTHVRAGRSIPR